MSKKKKSKKHNKNIRVCEMCGNGGYCNKPVFTCRYCGHVNGKEKE